MVATPTAMPSDKVIGRIKKLLTVANGKSNSDSEAIRAATEAEAAAAMQMVNDILLQYNLSLSDVNAHTDEVADDPLSRINEGSINLGKAGWAWKETLTRAVVAHNFCKIFGRRYDPETQKLVGYTLLGAPANVEITVMLLEWLFDQVTRLSAAEYRAGGHDGRTAMYDPETKRVRKQEYIRPTVWADSFGAGAVSRLRERLIEERERRERSDQAEQINAIVVHVESDIQAYLEAKYPHRKEERLRREERDRREEAARAAREQWEAEHPEEAEAQRRAAQLENARQMEEWAKADAKAAKKRRAYENAYYRRTGHYPGEGRRRRYDYGDDRSDTAYDRGQSRANEINLTPHLKEGKAGAPQIG